jgi:HEPN domain-containing protein
MPAKIRRLIFELTQKERETKFKAVLNEVAKKAAALNQPIVFRNELCIKPNLFIHKYPDGRTELIEQDSQNSSEKVVKSLN